MLLMLEYLLQKLSFIQYQECMQSSVYVHACMHSIYYIANIISYDKPTDIAFPDSLNCISYDVTDK